MSSRFAKRAVLGALLVLAFLPAMRAHAASSGPSVQTFVNQAVPPPAPEELLPEGMEWNKPMKAGDMVLPRLQKKKQQKPEEGELRAPTLPVGTVKAPQIKTSANPPQLKSGDGSSASMMLMQGMKKALQQAGRNPDLPVDSDSETSLSEGKKDLDGKTGEKEKSGAPVPLLLPPSKTGEAERKGLAGETRSEEKGGEEKGGIKYETGREPRDLAAFAPVAGEKTARPSPEEEKPSLEPEAAGSRAEAFLVDSSRAEAAGAGTPKTEIPRATDLSRPPVPLEKIPAGAAVAGAAGAAEISGQTAKPAKKPASIFGPPVSDKAGEKAGEEDKTAPAPEAKACEPVVTPWTRECSEVGYPANYTGKITGEKRIECPSGEVHDTWLSNTCAPAGGPAPAAGMGGAGAASAPEAQQARDSTARVDANCGAANGMATAKKPVADLCLAGSPSEVTGDGPWRWNCKGLNGGMTVSCAAPLASADEKVGKAGKPETSENAATAKPTAIEPQDGKCGAADGVGTDQAPFKDLCERGVASRVNGGGPWTWACSGTGGGQAAACSAPRKIDGVCGAAAGSGAEGRPERDLCASGYASAVTGEGPWHWTCSGLHGGSAATCSAAVKVNAVCGPASVTGHRTAPKEGLCRSGEPSRVEGEGPWTWTCSGESGGASVSCKAPVMIDGLCGEANGSVFSSAPRENLCAAGIAGRVTGTGPWSWNCAGIDGGDTAACTALVSGKEESKEGDSAACGPAAETAALTMPSHGLCSGGRASAVSGSGPWTWSCSGSDGHTVSCSTLAVEEGACGTAANVPSAAAPSGGLCASGTPGAVTHDKGRTHWKWDCKGSSATTTVSCSAPMISKGADSASGEDTIKCGEAAGKGTAEAPSSGLCAAGKPTAVKGGVSSWTWSCTAGKNRKVSCEAPLLVNGVCGPANGSIQKSAPLTGLCSAGTPTDIDGSGPWLWSCIGSGGGSSVSCSAASQAQARVDGVCGAAANAVMTSAPETNLCDSGAPSAVHGEGPWTWTCSGFNGGIASTCTTAKVTPKAPPPPAYPINGVCGPANGVAAVIRPIDGLCSAGTATDVSGNGPWNWSCLGANGGMTVSCTAPLMPPPPIDGVCGPAHGVTTLTPPGSGLCSAGIASAVSGKGPWTWSCSGTNGGAAVSCVAPLAGSSASSSSSRKTPSPAARPVKDEAPAPKAAPAGLVTPRLPAGQLPPLETGTLPQLKPSKPLDLPAEASARTSSAAPRITSGDSALSPPPLRDTVKPSPSLKPPHIDSEGREIEGARPKLDPDISSLSFARKSDEIDKEAAAALDKLAAVMSRHGGARITLNAYAAADGETTPREARRLSLARALAVRDYLTKKGISSGRIDVRALGANVPSGDMDRVDIKLN